MNLPSRIVVITLAAAFCLVDSAFAQKASVDAEVKGPDGHAVKNASVQIQRTDAKGTSIMAKTDARGHVVARDLEVGTYRITAKLATGAESSQVVKTQAAKPVRIIFEMKQPAANAVAAKKKAYRWVPNGTGSHMGGHYEEVGGTSQQSGPGASNVEQVNAAAIQRPAIGARPPGAR